MSLALYLASALFLFLSHAVLSGPRTRPALIARLGRAPFLALHSLVSLVALAAFITAYVRLDWNAWLYTPPTFAAPLAVALMPLAFFLVVARLTTPWREPESGIYRLARHPGSSGLLLWALLHLLAVGDARRVILFVTMAAIALYALVKNEIVYRREHEGPVDALSLVPFAPALAGRAPGAFAGIGWWRAALALLAYALLLALHPHLFGVDPLLRAW